MSNPNETLPGARPTPPTPAGKPNPPRPVEPAGETAPHPRPNVAQQPPAAPPPPVQPAPQQQPPAAQPPVHIGGNVGGDVVGGDLHKEQNAGRDIVGRDVVSNTTTTNVGFTAAAVQRLVLAVGALVAATAACFFVLGSVAAAGVVVALQRPVHVTNTAATSFAANLAALQSLPPGQPYEFTFSEEEISSYFHLALEPTLNGEIRDGQVRLLDSKHLALSGRAARLGGLRFAATFEWQKNRPGAALELTGALLHLAPLGNSPLGWVVVPTFALQPLAARLNSLFGNVEIVDVQSLPQGHAWDVTVLGH